MTRRRAVSCMLIAAMAPGEFLRGEMKDAAPSFDEIEKRSGGRLGCAVIDTSTGRRMGHRMSERFPMCSTFKIVATAFVLKRVERGQERLDRRIVFSAKEIVTYSPITGQRAGGDGMTVAELCYAAITQSDNTAANLILASFGGPDALNGFLRSIGDPVTRLDRTETSLNEAKPGDPRDTTTPEAMLQNMHRVLVGDVLSSTSRATLTQWLVECTTGGQRLRAGMPRDWKIGDKTGSGDNGTTNDVAVAWPPDRAPVLVAAYLTGSTLSAEERNAIIADVGRSVANMIQSV